MADPSTLSDLTRGRRTALIATLGGLWTIGPFSIDLYLPALPTLGGDLGAPQQQVAVTVTAFLLGLAFGQVQAGALSDTYGRRRPACCSTRSRAWAARSRRRPTASSRGSTVGAGGHASCRRGPAPTCRCAEARAVCA